MGLSLRCRKLKGKTHCLRSWHSHLVAKAVTSWGEAIQPLSKNGESGFRSAMFSAADLEQDLTTVASRSNLACHLLLYGLQAKNDFYMFKWLRIITGILLLHTIHIAESIILLECSQAHCFASCLLSMAAFTQAELSSGDKRPPGLWSQKYLLSGLWEEKFTDLI